LLRLWQQFGDSPLRRIAPDDSLLLVEIFIPSTGLRTELPGSGISGSEPDNSAAAPDLPDRSYLKMTLSG